MLHRTHLSDFDSLREKAGQISLGMLKLKVGASYAVDLLVVTIVSLAFRLVNLANYPRWYVDEGSYAQLGINITRGIWGYATRWPNFFQPIFPAIQAIVFMFASHDYFWARLSGALIGCVSCVLMYAIGRRLSGRLEAIVASVFLALASTYINRLGLQDNFVEFFLILTVLFYLESEKRGKKWTVLTGLAAGLAFLSKFTGIVAPMYIIVRSISDKRVRVNLPAILTLLLTSSLHLVIGFLFDWNGFVAETLGIYASRPLDPVSILLLIVLGAPVSQLQVSSPGATISLIQSPLQIFSLIGFLCTLWILATKKDQNSVMISAWMISVIATLVFSGQVFWARLVYLYPVYGLAIGATFARSEWRLRVLSATHIIRGLFSSPLIWLSSLLALTVTLYGISFGQLVDKALFFAWLPALFVIGSRLRIQFKPLARSAILGSIVVLLISASAFQAYQVTANETSDQAGIVQYLNEHTSKTDLVATNSAISWLLSSVGVNYAEVAFYTTHEPTYTYIPEQLSRFRMNISLWNCKYIVLDTPWLRDELGGSKSVELLTPIILQTWTRVYAIGDYQVFGSRGISAFKLTGTVQTADFPVDKSQVKIYPSNSSIGYSSNTTTDAGGRYVLYAPRGTYVFEVNPPRGSHLANYKENDLSIIDSVTHNVTLFTGVILSGLALNSDGTTPVQNCLVTLYSPMTQLDYGSSSNSMGHYEIAAPAGDYVLDAHPPTGLGPLHYIPYQERDFKLVSDTYKSIVLETGYLVNGFVSDSQHRPIAGAWVSAYYQPTGRVYGAYTNSSGYYAFLVPPGKYVFDIWPPPTSTSTHFQKTDFMIEGPIEFDITLS